ncbi:MAG TPA: hypothetical protein DD381_07370 [Lentisphaeria bacterium]|nr:MAG: hypothetical protein A2X47_03945 [Lentisphaerae bacterium GWF2_38_69]HBM16141.1 hypothetical protein [Lentisphaeria bacterium]
MSRYERYSNYGYPEYESAAERREKAVRNLAKLQSKGKHGDLSPIVIEGTKIAKSWWGKAWCENLESYADYSNRIGRGRSYVKNGLVIDLKISKGLVTALVMGSSSTPYKIEISIKTLESKVWSNLKEKLKNKFDSLQTLLCGEFPEDLKHVFSSKDFGFFPSPKEIKMDCSCPDYASLCKHLAAVLYGVGAKLDSKSELIFTLRGVDVNELTASVMEEQKKVITEKVTKAKKSKKIIEIEDTEMSAVFGIDIQVETQNIASPPAKKKAAPKKKVSAAKIEEKKTKEPKIKPKRTVKKK